MSIPSEEQVNELLARQRLTNINRIGHNDTVYFTVSKSLPLRHPEIKSRVLQVPMRCVHPPDTFKNNLGIRAAVLDPMIWNLATAMGTPRKHPGLWNCKQRHKSCAIDKEDFVRDVKSAMPDLNDDEIPLYHDWWKWLLILDTAARAKMQLIALPRVIAMYSGREDSAKMIIKWMFVDLDPELAATNLTGMAPLSHMPMYKYAEGALLELLTLIDSILREDPSFKDFESSLDPAMRWIIGLIHQMHHVCDRIYLQKAIEAALMETPNLLRKDGLDVIMNQIPLRRKQTIFPTEKQVAVDPILMHMLCFCTTSLFHVYFNNEKGLIGLCESILDAEWDIQHGVISWKPQHNNLIRKVCDWLVAQARPDLKVHSIDFSNGNVVLLH